MSGIHRIGILALALGLAPVASRAATPIVPIAWREAFIPNGFQAGELISFTTDAPQPAPALRIATAAATENPWDRRLLAIGNARVAAGDTGLLRFRMRTVGMGVKPGFAKFVVQAANQPYRKSVEWSLRIDAEWRQYEIPFHFAEAYPASLYTAEFWFPFAQTLEITALTMEHHGAASFASLGLADYPYPGHESAASWRTAAESRIEEVRKGELNVVVRDAAGKPMAGAPVRLRMRRHAFAFGSAVAADGLRDGTANGEQYRTQVVKLFNSAVLENDLKWFEWESDRTRALLGLAWLKTNGIREVRGHTILWPDWTRMPPDVAKQSGDPIAVRARINKHIEELVASARGLVTEWDVVNEPVSANVLERVLGADEMPKWFQQTRALDPSTRLYANEYAVVDDGGENILQQDRYAALIESLIARGTPIDGIGIQAHIGDRLTSPEQLLAILDRYAKYGKDLKITEFDVAGENEAIQADYTRDFLTAAFSHPKMTGVYLWGFWAGRHYRPEAALYRQDWTAKPAAKIWDDLIFRQWWSDVSGVTDANGSFRARVFYGDYDIETGAGTSAATQSLSYLPGVSNTVSFGSFDIGPLSPTGVRNAASLATGPIAPGEQLVIRTRDFGPEPAAISKPDANGQYPTALTGRQVRINGTAVPILETSADSIRCAVPSGIGAIATVQLNLFGKLSNAVYLPVADAAPGVFTTTANGQGAALLLDDQGTPVKSAAAGEYVTIRSTGVMPGLNLRVFIGQTPATDVQVVALSATTTAIRFRIPATVPPRDSTLRIVASAQASQEGVTITVDPSP
jgi:endo-1,4-beta-xylanase